MLNDAVPAVPDEFKSNGSPHPARALARAHGSEVHQPGGQRKGRCISLTRTIGNGTSAALSLDHAHLRGTGEPPSGAVGAPGGRLRHRGASLTWAGCRLQ